MNNDELSIERLIRIETRIARIQEHLGLPTRMDTESIERLEHASEQPLNKRLARIETKVFKVMEALNINPRTGRKYEAQTSTKETNERPQRTGGWRPL